MVDVIQHNKEREMDSSINSYSTFDLGEKHFLNEKKIHNFSVNSLVQYIFVFRQVNIT